MYHIIVNPQGGKGKSLKALKVVTEILNQNNVSFTVHHTERIGHATEITKELSKVPNTKIIVMGGDGSINEVLNGIENFENVTLGFIPCGTGNDFIGTSGHPLDFKEALNLILDGEVGYIDYIQLGNKRCMNVLGAGMDVDVLLRYESMKFFKGKLKYYMSLFGTLLHARFHKLRITVDNGEPMERSVFMTGIGNGRCIGGGMPICPNAKINDGKLQVVIINEIKKHKIIGALLGFLKGKHVNKPYTEVFDAQQVKVEVLDDSKFEMDGEIFDDKDITCQVVSNKLKVFI